MAPAHSTQFSTSVERENDLRGTSTSAPMARAPHPYWEADREFRSARRERDEYYQPRTELRLPTPRSSPGGDDRENRAHPSVDLSTLIPMYGPGETQGPDSRTQLMDHSYHNPWPSPSQYPPFALDAKYPPWHAPTQWNPSVGGSSLLLRPFPEYAPYPSPSSSTSSPPLPTYPLSAPPSPRRWGRGSLKDTSKDKQCAHCHATATPLWRREPATGRTLCNACGLYLQQRNKLRPQALIDADADDAADATAHIPDAEYVGPTCSHCGTRQTSVWRRSKAGARVCNACGVYARLRGKERPLSLRRNKVKPRTKHAR